MMQFQLLCLLHAFIAQHPPVSSGVIQPSLYCTIAQFMVHHRLKLCMIMLLDGKVPPKAKHKASPAVNSTSSFLLKSRAKRPSRAASRTALTGCPCCSLSHLDVLVLHQGHNLLQRPLQCRFCVHGL